MKTRAFAAFTLFAVAMLVNAAVAQVPDANHFQGVLRNDADVPLTGDFAMTFRFFDSATLGNEILVDAHPVVSVSEGLFDVELGTGNVSDGSAILPGDPYLSLIEVFRDFPAAWIEIEIGGQTLTPRSPIRSAPYAMNAATLNGLESSDLLDTSTNNQFKAGHLTVGSMDVDGGLRLTDEFATSIRFNHNGDPNAETFSWDPADVSFQMSDGLQLEGPIMTGGTAAAATAYNRLGAVGAPNGPNVSTGNDLFVSDSIEVNGDAYFSGEIVIDNDGPEQDGRIYFYDNGNPTAEVIQWDTSSNRFEFSGPVAVGGSLRVGTTSLDNTSYNIFKDATGTPEHTHNGPGDVYIADDLEVDHRLYLDGLLYMQDAVEQSQSIHFFDDGALHGESIQWDDPNDEFRFSDDVFILGQLSAGAKNFIQNHPYRDDLEIVYTAMEGDEATVYTRGSGVVRDGVATVPLGETFRLVANPDLGLTAHLTPRGHGAILHVESLTPETLVVRSSAFPDASGEHGEVAFDYIVYGLRVGYEQAPPLRPKHTNAPLPETDRWDPAVAAFPELAGTTPLARYQASRVDRTGVPADLARAVALRSRMQPKPGETEESIQNFGIAPSPAARDADAGEVGRRTGPDADPATAAAPDPADAPASPAQGFTTPVPSEATAAPVEYVEDDPDRFDVSGRVEPGDVLVVDPEFPGRFAVAAGPADPTVIGIVKTSGAPDDATTPTRPFTGTAPVATHGIVLCKVDATFREIRTGDLLVTAERPGHAMSAIDPRPGTVIAKALEPLDSGTGTIRVLVTAR